MITIRWALGAIIAATAVSASTDELQFFSRLLKRQEPGTPAYNCHDNCGQAIIQGRNSADVCNDNIFLTDYQNCLQCAGPDNVNIWQYYGNTLSRTASTCGLSTTPLSGKQPDVGPAIPAGSASSSSSSSAPPSSSSATEGTTQTSVTEPTSAPEPTNTDSSSSSSQGESSATSGAGEVTSASSTGTSASSGSSAGYPTASATESSSKTSASGGVTTPYPTTTGTGSGAGNGTATTSSGIVVVTGGANAFAASNVGFYGALALGALYVAAQ